MSRRPIVAANWKMHKVRGEATSFCRDLAGGLGAASCDVVIFPSFPLLPAVEDALAGVAGVAWGGQDLHPEAAGAHTGDVSGRQLADVGCRWVLVGHSERRHDHGERSALVGKKARAAVAAGLRPMICLGETRDQRAADATEEVLAEQLAAALETLGDGVDAGGFALAYEPVWAIGTGETATPAMAQAAHAFLRGELGRQRGEAAAASVRILYGGSVKPHNAGELITQDDLDGFLVGGASLDAASFLAIIRACDA